jgi:hypothetical protein
MIIEPVNAIGNRDPSYVAVSKQRSWMQRQRIPDRFCGETNAARLTVFSQLESSKMSA